MKVIKSLKKRGILLKGIARKYSSQEEEFLNFLCPLMTARLPLMNNILTLLSKSVLISLGLSARTSAIDAAIQKKTYGSESTALMILNGKNGIV